MSGYGPCLEVTPECPVEYSIYGYYPSLGANAFFLTFFATFFFLNLGLGVYYKTWSYAVFMCLACILEALGYAGRLMLHKNPYDNNGFIMQICCLIMGPALNSGAIYLSLKHITLTFGAEWSRIKPHLYTWVFITGDLIALVLQAVGGAMASTSGDDETQLKNGDHITTAGISWQVFTLFVFGLAVVDYTVRRARSITALSTKAAVTLGDSKFRLFAGGVALAWLTVFIRCVYRIVEFAKGWSNPIMRNQTGFIVLEGVMIVLANFCLTVPHPGICFPALSSRSKIDSIDEPKVVASDETSREVLTVEKK